MTAISGGSGSSGGGKLNVGGSSPCTTDKVVDLKGGTPPTGGGGTTSSAPCKTCFVYTNILFVDPNGDNANGTVGDIFKPWQTVASAESIAASGDLIWIMPGSYSESNLGKNGVQYYLTANTTINGNFRDNGNAISFSIHGEGTITNNAVTISQTAASTISVFDVEVKSTTDNAVISQTAGIIKLTRANLINTNEGSSAHGITTTVTSSTYNARLEDMYIILTSSTAEAINASNAYTVFCITDIGSTNSFNANVTNYHPGTFMYTESLLAL